MKVPRRTAGPAPAAPRYQWTRKVKGKTVSVALSKERYEWLAAAIVNWGTVQATLKAMQKLSRSVLFTTVPGAPRSKTPRQESPRDYPSAIRLKPLVSYDLKSVPLGYTETEPSSEQSSAINLQVFND